MIQDLSHLLDIFVQSTREQAQRMETTSIPLQVRAARANDNFIEVVAAQPEPKKLELVEIRSVPNNENPKMLKVSSLFEENGLGALTVVKPEVKAQPKKPLMQIFLTGIKSIISNPNHLFSVSSDLGKPVTGISDRNNYRFGNYMYEDVYELPSNVIMFPRHRQIA